MSEFDWAAGQGDQWLAQLTGLEAMMKEIDEPLLDALSFPAVAADAPIRIADIASGGGGTTFEIEALVPPSSVIHGFDISSALVESANARAQKQSQRATFETANLQTAAVPNQLYDYVVSRFGVMFFDEPSAAFSNIHQWLKPQGQFAFAVWGEPKQNPWMYLLREVASQFVDLPKTERSAPGPFRYSDPDILVKELNSAGFSGIKHQEWRGQLPLGGGLDAANAANFGLSVFTITEPLNEAGGTVLGDAERALTDKLKTFEKNGTVMMDAQVYIVSGQA